MLMFHTPELSGGGGGDLSRSPPEFRWCWSRRPWLGELHVWGAHVMNRGNDSQLEGLFTITVLACRWLRGRCPIPGLPVLMLLLALWARLGRCPHLTVTLGPAGPYVAGGPVGPDGTLSPFIHNHAGPAGRHVAIGPVGPFGTLSPSEFHPAGPAGPYVAGGPVGPDGTLSPFIPNHTGPAGRHVTIGLMGPFGTLSPPDCYSPGLMGPCVAGGPVGPDGTLSPCISDYADPAGRHVAVGPGGPSGTVSRFPPILRSWWTLVGGPKFCPDVLEDDLVLGAAVPLPAVTNS